MEDRIATQERGGAAIERLCIEQGRTKWWVAKEAGTHPAHLSKLISGERPITARMAKRLAAVLGVPPSTFLPDLQEDDYENPE